MKFVGEIYFYMQNHLQHIYMGAIYMHIHTVSDIYIETYIYEEEDIAYTYR